MRLVSSIIFSTLYEPLYFIEKAEEVLYTYYEDE